MKPNLSPAQKELLELLHPKEVQSFYESLKLLHYLATYCVSTELVELSASKDVQNLINVLEGLVLEAS